jgi:ADP-heptose:LPS heptosyltransferase
MKIKVRRIFNGTIFLSTETSIDTEVEISALSEQKEIIDVFIQAKWSEDGDIWISHPLFLLYSKIELVIRAQGEEETSFFVHFNYLDPHNLSNFVDEEQLVKYRKEGAPERISFGCTDLIFSHPYKYFKENPEEDKPVLLNVSRVAGIGDALCSTPTVKKLAEVYGKRICVISRRPEVYFNNPNVDKVFITTDSFLMSYKYPLSDKDLKETALRRGYFVNEYFEGLSTPNFQHIEKQVDQFSDDMVSDETHAPFPLRYTNYQLVEMYSTGLGFMLLDKEKTIEYRPHKAKDFNLKDYVLCNISASTSLRFWGFHEWNAFFRLLKQAGLKVAVTGYRDYHRIGSTFVNRQDKVGLVFDRIFHPNEKEELDTSGLLDLTRTISNINDVQQMIEQCKVLVTINTDMLHLCGSTDTWLVLLGGAQHPELIMPYRHGSRDYKSFYVPGSCELHCDSQLKYSIKHFRDNGWEKPMASKIHVDTFCQEFFDEPKCQPKAEQVFEKVKEIYNLK